ncbi:MAG TPA: hypothetical protein VMF13_23295 [Luteitalea sp.]|nr:hypothetical protein [Luteitalea sp.]
MTCLHRVGVRATATAALALATGCGSGTTPASPSPSANTVLEPGDVQLHVVAPAGPSGCTGALPVPVLSGNINLRLERAGGTTLIASATGTQGDLTIRFVESQRGAPGFASIEGSASGAGQLASDGGLLSMRLSDNRLTGTAVPAGASGDMAGPVVFTVDDASVVSCATARWSMARAPR